MRLTYLTVLCLISLFRYPYSIKSFWRRYWELCRVSISIGDQSSSCCQVFISATYLHIWLINWRAFTSKLSADSSLISEIGCLCSCISNVKLHITAYYTAIQSDPCWTLYLLYSILMHQFDAIRINFFVQRCVEFSTQDSTHQPLSFVCVKIFWSVLLFIYFIFFSHRTLDEGDELAFLRVRSKKHEIMIAPDKDYILVVIQNPQEI